MALAISCYAWGMNRFVKFLAILALVACIPAATAINAIVTVSTELCTEEAADPAEPDWVKLACKVDGVVGGIVHVLFPSSQWKAMKLAAAAKKTGPAADGGAALADAGAADAAAPPRDH